MSLQVDSKKETNEEFEEDIIENYCDDFVRLLESMEALTDILIFFDGFRFSKKSINFTTKSLKDFRLCNCEVSQPKKATCKSCALILHRKI